MFKFAHPEFLYLFAAIPLLMSLFVYSQRMMRKREMKFGTRSVLKRLTPLRSILRSWVRFVLFCIVLVLGVLLLARPQFGITTGAEKRKGIEAIIALDVSQSMLAQDVNPSRMERSKLLISTLVNRMINDKVGLIVFAGEAYPQLPITNDYVSAQLFLDNIKSEMIALQGTNVGAAINLANKSFSQDKEVGKAIIVITDGENHEDGAKEAATEAAKMGHRVFVLGVGSTQGAEIPTENGVLTDRSGNIVRTALNEAACREVAQAGKGAYIHVDGSNIAQDQLQAELRKLQQTDSGAVSDGSLDEQFQAVALLMFIILVIQMFVLEKQNPFFSRLRIFQK